MNSSSKIHSWEITSENNYINRRQFIRATGLAVGAGIASSALPGLALAENRELDTVPGPFSTDEAPNSWEDVTTYNNFYEFGTDKEDPYRNAQRFQPRPWSVEVSGECGKPGVYGYEDIVGPHTLEDRVYRHRCVEAWSMVIPWVGFPLASLLKEVDPTSQAKYVRFETLYDPEQMPGQMSSMFPWPYVEGLRLDEAMHPLALLCVGMYGAELPPQDGAPVRLVVPWKYGFKSIKSIVRIDLVEEMPTSLWMASSPNEYGFWANVNPEVDHPRWSQATERRIGEGRRETLFLNGYAEEVAGLYTDLDSRDWYY